MVIYVIEETGDVEQQGGANQTAGVGRADRAEGTSQHRRWKTRSCHQIEPVRPVGTLLARPVPKTGPDWTRWRVLLMGG